MLYMPREKNDSILYTSRIRIVKTKRVRKFYTPGKTSQHPWKTLEKSWNFFPTFAYAPWTWLLCKVAWDHTWLECKVAWPHTPRTHMLFLHVTCCLLRRISYDITLIVCHTGYYAFIDVSEKEPGERVGYSLQLAPYRVNNADLAFRLKFFYHMWGDDIARLDVVADNEVIWTRVGRMFSIFVWCFLAQLHYHDILLNFCRLNWLGLYSSSCAICMS